MRTTGINLEDTKRSNRLLVLRLLCSGRGLSRTEITRQVGLAKMTVTNITAELLRAGLIREAAGEHAGAGRPQMRLELTPRAPAVLGLDLHRDVCYGLAATMDLKVLGRTEFPLGPEDTGETLLNKMEAAAETLAAFCGSRPVLGAGVSAMGPLDAQRGELLHPLDFYGIHSVSVKKALEERLSLPVYLANGMSASALAEKLYGRCAAYRNFVYVGLSYGVGSGLVLNDSLFLGSRGFAGEIGHMTVDCSGPLCTCGNRGCLEAYLSVPRVLALFQETFGRDFPDLSRVCAFCEENEKAAALLDSLLEKLAVALINLCNLTDLEAVVLGHDSALLSDAHLARVERRVDRGILARGLAHIPVLRSSFGTQASLYGAAVLPLTRIFDGELGYDRFFASP